MAGYDNQTAPVTDFCGQFSGRPYRICGRKHFFDCLSNVDVAFKRVRTLNPQTIEYSYF